MTHAPLWGGSNTCNETYYRFVLGIVLADPISSHLFVLSSNLTDHNDSLSLRVLHEALKNVNEVGSIEWITTNSYDGRLS